MPCFNNEQEEEVLETTAQKVMRIQAMNKKVNKEFTEHNAKMQALVRSIRSMYVRLLHVIKGITQPGNKIHESLRNFPG